MESEIAKSIKKSLDLQKINAVVVAEQNATSALLSGQLRALKVGAVHAFANGDVAIDRMVNAPRIEADIVIVEWNSQDQADLIKRLRRVGPRRLRELPLIAIMSRADVDTVLMARDSGANAVLARPLSAAQLLDKVTWALTTEIPFVRAEGYVGPDRRRFRGIEFDGPDRRHEPGPREAPRKS